MVTVCDIETAALIDSGSMVTTVSEEFYRSLIPRPELHGDFKLSLQGPDGSLLKYFGIIIVKIELSFIDELMYVPALVVPNTDYNFKVPIIVGTNAIREAQVQCKKSTAPAQWEIAFLSLQTGYIGNVKSTNKIDMEIKPYETVTVSGLLKKDQRMESEKASDRIAICPRVVLLKSDGRNHRVPVRIFNISARPIIIKPQTLLCELQQVKVIRNADIGETTSSTQSANIASQMKTDTEESPTLPEGVKLENTKLTDDQMETVTELFHRWKHVFSTGLTDIGQTDLIKHRIRLNNEEPFKEPYKHSSSPYSRSSGTLRGNEERWCYKSK